MNNLFLDWKISGSRIHFDYQGLQIFFQMPSFVTVLPPDPQLRLCEWLMLSPWHDIPEEPCPMRPHITTSPSFCLLSFSAGVDSTAAYQVMQGCQPVYVERSGTNTKTLLRQASHIAFCEHINAIRITTNFELIRTKYDKMVGYSTGRGMAVPLILLAAAICAHSIAYGAVLDDNTFATGRFRPPTPAYFARQKRFTDAGLICVEPLFGCSEVITTQIVDMGLFPGMARSCLRGGIEKPCGRCYKCFRKSLLRGSMPPMNPEAEKAIAKNPPKMAGPLIWGMQLVGEAYAGMQYAMEMKTGFLERHYFPLLDLMPIGVGAVVRNRLQAYGIEPMTEEDVADMYAADFRRVE